jgi:hypothetical protein
MRDYLLGTLEADQRSALEERILCDPQVYEQLLIAEKELIDEYVAGSLSKLEQHQFETHLLNTAERQKNLRFGRLLKERLNSHRPAAETAPANSLPSYLALFRKAPVLAIAGALVIGLGIVFFSWLMAQKSAEDLVRQSAPGLVVVTLSPNSTKAPGTTQLLTVPPRVSDVKLELELTNTGFHNYKSELFRGSEALDTRDGLIMEAKGDRHRVVPVIIASRNLSAGEYQVRLIGVLDSGEEQFIDVYSFRVTAR